MTRKQATYLKDKMNSIISNCIGGPGGDPTWEHLQSAADAYKTLKKFNLPVDDENDVKLILTKENICGKNFLN